MNARVAALAIALCFAPSASAETFATDDGFSVTLPAGWIAIPPEALRELEAALGAVADGATGQQRYDHAYQLASASRWFEYPYILVQVRRAGRVSEGELMQHEKVQSKMREGMDEAEASLGSIVSGVEQGETLYDESDHVLWSAVAMNVQDIGVVKGLVAVKLTEFGVIQMMGYATEGTFEQYAPVFREAVQGLDVDDEPRYRPRLTDRAPMLWGINLGETAIAALVGALAGGVVGLIWHLRRKRSRSSG